MVFSLTIEFNKSKNYLLLLLAMVVLIGLTLPFMVLDVDEPSIVEE